MSRRERVREATRDEIKALARQQMAANGTAALALNAVARDLGMVPSALYRYFPDRDSLITALVVDAYAGLADALRVADHAAPAQAYDTRMLEVAFAYRRWALDTPVEFQLIFGNPIPGYHAPPEETKPESQRVFAVFLDIIQAAEVAGQLRAAPDYNPAALAPCAPDHFFSVYAPLVMYSGIMGWTLFHGVVTLELFGHLRHPLADPEAFYQAQVRRYIATIGLSANTH